MLEIRGEFVEGNAPCRRPAVAHRGEYIVDVGGVSLGTDLSICQGVEAGTSNGTVGLGEVGNALSVKKGFYRSTVHAPACAGVSLSGFVGIQLGCRFLEARAVLGL